SRASRRIPCGLQRRPESTARSRSKSPSAPPRGRFDFDDGGDLSLAKAPKEVRHLQIAEAVAFDGPSRDRIWIYPPSGGGELSCAAAVRVRGGKPASSWRETDFCLDSDRGPFRRFGTLAF